MLSQDFVDIFDGCMGINGAYGAVDVGQYALGFTQCIGNQDAVDAQRAVTGPPAIDFVHDHRLRLPAVDGQPKGTFCYKMLAGNGLIGLRQAVGLGLVVAGYNPYLTFAGYPYLG